MDQSFSFYAVVFNNETGRYETLDLIVEYTCSSYREAEELASKLNAFNDTQQEREFNQDCPF